MLPTPEKDEKWFRSEVMVEFKRKWRWHQPPVPFASVGLVAKRISADFAGGVAVQNEHSECGGLGCIEVLFLAGWSVQDRYSSTSIVEMNIVFW